jgi:hypothetical protein
MKEVRQFRGVFAFLRSSSVARRQERRERGLVRAAGAGKCLVRIVSIVQRLVDRLHLDVFAPPGDGHEIRRRIGVVFFDRWRGTRGESNECTEHDVVNWPAIGDRHPTDGHSSKTRN